MADHHPVPSCLDRNRFPFLPDPSNYEAKTSMQGLSFGTRRYLSRRLKRS